jgi:hypothetical protein
MTPQRSGQARRHGRGGRASDRLGLRGTLARRRVGLGPWVQLRPHAPDATLFEPAGGRAVLAGKR